jgi:hypothetical protein
VRSHRECKFTCRALWIAVLFDFLAFVFLTGLMYPAMTGIVDLSLRARVP